MKVLISNFLLVCLAMVFCSSGRAFDKSLVLYYSFDEGSGKAVKDLSQYKNDGVADGNPKWVQGKFNTAIQFDGETMVEAPANTTLDLTGAHTISFWLKWDGSVKGWSPFISKTKSATDDNYHVWVGRDKVWDYENKPHGQAHGKTKIPLDDKWIYLTVVHDGKESISFYIDGKLDNTEKLPTTTACSDCPFRVGDDGKNNRGAGTIDELAVFNRAVTVAEINKLMNEGSEPIVTAVESAGKLTATWGDIRNKF